MGHSADAVEAVKAGVDDEPRDRRQRVQSVETGMAVLKGLARLGGRSSLTALAAHVGESPAKVHRYLSSLVGQGLVAQDAATQQYLLGPECILIGLSAIRQAEPIRAAEPSLARLREAHQVTCFLAVMGNRGPTIVRFEEPALPVTINVRAGSVLSLLWSATGRAFLGLMDDPGLLQAARDEWSATSARTCEAWAGRDDPVEALRQEVREAGVGWVKDSYLAGISAVAAPVRDHTGRVCAVITALGATGGFDARPDGDIAHALRREAGQVSRALGYGP